MAVLEERLNKTDTEKVGLAIYQYILNVPLWNDWSKITYSEEHGSPVFKTLSFKSLNKISARIFAELIHFGQDPKLRRPRTFWKESLVFY